jgi:HlyD family secretion protein
MKYFYLLIFLSFLSVNADEKSVTVKKKSLYEKKTFTGYASSSEVQSVKLESKKWSKWIIEEIVLHGQVVKKGDVLVRFESKALNAEILRKQRDLRLQELKITQQKQTLRAVIHEASQEISLSRLKAEIAEKAELLYKNSGRDRFLNGYENDILDTQKNLKYQQAELSQLKKMYVEDSLAEESEEIVLERQEDAVARAKRFVEIRKLVKEEALALKLPMTDFSKKYSKEKALNTAASAKLNWDYHVESEKLNLVKAELSFKKAMESLNKLILEKEKLVLRASNSGTAYIGNFYKGKWNTDSKKKLGKGDSILLGVSFMTVVGESLNRVVISVPEVSRRFLKGQHVTLNLGARYKAQRVSDSSIPVNGFNEVELKIPNDLVTFGQKVSIMSVLKIGEVNLTVSLKAIRYKDSAPEKAYVLKKEGAKNTEVYIKTGQVIEGSCVVLAGLSEGDVVILP